MKYISSCILGVFVIEDNNIVDKILFNKDPEEIASKLADIQNSDEFKVLSKKLNA